MLRCSICAAPVTDHEAAREFSAWEIRRGKGLRTIGKKRTGRVACGGCAFDMANGLAPNTPKLL